MSVAITFIALVVLNLGTLHLIDPADDLSLLTRLVVLVPMDLGCLYLKSGFMR